MLTHVPKCGDILVLAHGSKGSSWIVSRSAFKLDVSGMRSDVSELRHQTRK